MGVGFGFGAFGSRWGFLFFCVFLWVEVLVYLVFLGAEIAVFKRVSFESRDLHLSWGPPLMMQIA